MFAGSAMAQVGIGVEAGINLNNLADRYENETQSNQIKVGPHAGLVFDIPVGTNFSVAPAIRWSQKGAVVESNYNGVNGNGQPAAIEEKSKRTYNYVEVPINLVYKTGTPGAGRFMIGAGPYIAYLAHASEKLKMTMRVAGVEDEEAVVSDHQIGVGEKDDDELKALDYGAQAFLGYQMSSGIFAKVGSSVGFANTALNKNMNGDFQSKNYNFFFTLGYMFK